MLLLVLLVLLALVVLLVLFVLLVLLLRRLRPSVSGAKASPTATPRSKVSECVPRNSSSASSRVAATR